MSCVAVSLKRHDVPCDLIQSFAFCCFEASLLPIPLPYCDCNRANFRLVLHYAPPTNMLLTGMWTAEY